VVEIVVGIVWFEIVVEYEFEVDGY
jgi:hypothetical protein